MVGQLPVARQLCWVPIYHDA